MDIKYRTRNSTYDSKNKFLRVLRLGVLILATVPIWQTNVVAEIVFDGSLPGGATNGTTITGDMLVQEANGLVSGSNLFHSFSGFNIDTGETLRFFSMNNFNNVIARVTGNSISNIDGSITNLVPGSDLWLMNPNGFIFGQNASINVAGSFYAGTGDSLEFSDGSRLYADLAQTSNLASLDPVSFGFIDPASAAAIQVNQSTITLGSSGSDFSLTAGDVTFTGATVSTTAGGNISINATGDITFEEGGDISTTTSAATNAGNINVTAEGNININGSLISVDLLDLLGNVVGTRIISDNDSGIKSSTLATGSTGILSINSGNIYMDGGIISTDTSGLGDARDINIVVDGLIDMINNGQILSNKLGKEVIGINKTVGNINVVTGDLNMSGSIISNATSFDASGRLPSNIQINVDGDIVLFNSLITSGTSFSADAGNITISSNNLYMQHSEISSSTNFCALGGVCTPGKGFTDFASLVYGDAGDIDINVIGLVDMQSESWIRSESVNSAAYDTYGGSGRITINANDLNLYKGSQIKTSTNSASSELSIIDLNIQNGVVIYGSTTGQVINPYTGEYGLSGAPRYSGVFTETYGNTHAGNIFLDAINIEIVEGSQITSSTFAEGNAGSIAITANNFITVVNGLIESQSTGSTSGSAGTVSLSAANISLDAGGIINASTQSNELTNTVANVTLTASNNVSIGENSQVTTSTTGAVDAGIISITATETVLIGAEVETAEKSIIESRSTGANSGSAGTINVQANDIVLKNSFKIAASTESNILANSPSNINLMANNTISTSDTVSDSTIGQGWVDSTVYGLSDGGQINISAATMDIRNLLIGTETFAGNGGDTFLSATNITLSDVSFSSNTSSAGNAGNLTIEAGNNLSISDFEAYATTSGPGSAGAIALSATNIDFDGILETSTRYEGNAGNVSLSATGDINITKSLISSSSGTDMSGFQGWGNVGNINISGNNVTIGTTNGQPTHIKTNTSTYLANVTPGSINITAAENLLIYGRPIDALFPQEDTTIISANTLGPSDAGQITLNARNIQLSSGAIIDTSAYVSNENYLGGNAGAISLNADETIQLNNATISSQSFNESNPNVENTTIGDAGEINITAKRLSIIDGGQIVTDTISANGLSASINITTESVDINGNGLRTNYDTWYARVMDGTTTVLMDEYVSGVYSRAYGSTGAGSININTANFLLTDGGTLSASSVGTGVAGDINLTASKTINLDSGIIKTISEQSSGGNININAIEYIGIQNSLITAEANGVTAGNDGGNISIDPILLFIDNSSIIANANAGNGGNIDIVADNMIIGLDNTIEASSNTGIDGDVAVETPNQYQGTDTEQETPFLDITGLMGNSCVAEQRTRSSFTTEERNYLYFKPDSYLPSTIGGSIKTNKMKKKDLQASVSF